MWFMADFGKLAIMVVVVMNHFARDYHADALGTNEPTTGHLFALALCSIETLRNIEPIGSMIRREALTVTNELLKHDLDSFLCELDDRWHRLGMVLASSRKFEIEWTAAVQFVT